MTEGHSLRTRVAVVLAAVAALAAAGTIAAFWTTAASADGRALAGDFCTTPTGSMLCMTLTWDGVAYGTTNRADLELRPGTYWLTVNDNSSMHDFALRSCPGSTSPCTSSNPASDGGVELTTVAEAPGAVTNAILLKHGTYRLYCDAGHGFHESHGMYVDFEVGGVGQLDS
jgi:hypothetical protein